MGFIGDLLYRLLESFSGENPLVAAIAATVALAAIVTPFVQRYASRRKRVLYRVQSDSKIGLDVDLDGDQPLYADPYLADVSTMFKGLSSVVIRIRNTGGDVSVGDLGEPVEFVFADRVIWNDRVSDPSHRADDDDRRKLADGLEFFSTDPVSPAARPSTRPATLPEVRRTLPQRLRDAFRPVPTGSAPVAEPEPESPPPVWHGIRLKPSLHLKARERFKLIVVLSEPAGKRAGHVSKGVSGPVGHKRIKDERNVRRALWPLVTAAFGVLLAGLWIAAVVILPIDTPGPAVDCAEGRLTIVGSTAFAPTMKDIAEEYTAACGTEITVAPDGSAEGVRQVAGVEPAHQAELAAMSDGRSGEATQDMTARPIAVIVYTVIVNEAVGVDQLTVRQVQDIYAGRYQDWNQLRAGPSMPIRVVGRGGESGSRRTFEQTMLDGASQGELTSDSCETADRVVGAPVIRCERNSEEGVVDEVAATPGAIGYVDLASANQTTRDHLPVTVQKLDGQYPDVSSAAAGYPFWTIEYLYTKGSPEEDTVLQSLIAYLRTKTVYAELVEAGYTPCVTTDGQTYLLCR
ncbi:PstS family phosphate ABC transporter substrate-binding protein [Actinophytocola sp.]|uniref:PstS family phosphate ABC transporter substrate-binding protein n=1 Tax=Actinophytocola sp. TaxID=1872138 RepID=UPI002ED18D01